MRIKSEAALLFDQYVQRKRLTELGITVPVSTYGPFMLEVLLTCDEMVSRELSKDRAKKKK